MTNETTIRAAAAFSDGDVIVKTKGNGRGKVGVVAYALSDEVRIRWSKRSWRLPEISTFTGAVYPPFRCAISSSTTVATLRKQGAKKISIDLLREWTERLASIENDPGLNFSEKYDRGRALRDEMIERAEPVDYDRAEAKTIARMIEFAIEHDFDFLVEENAVDLNDLCSKTGLDPNEFLR